MDIITVDMLLYMLSYRYTHGYMDVDHIILCGCIHGYSYMTDCNFLCSVILIPALYKWASVSIYIYIIYT